MESTHWSPIGLSFNHKDSYNYFEASSPVNHNYFGLENSCEHLSEVDLQPEWNFYVSYDKKDALFSELEKEAHHTFNEDLSADVPRVQDFGTLFESEAEPRDNTSLASENSNEASVMETSNRKSTFCSKQSSQPEITTHSESCEHEKTRENSYTGKLKEGDLVFIVRKVDKKTNKSKLLTRHRKKISKCEHTHLEYYAKGMCKNCYHNKGKRSKKASKWEHTDRDHYAKGLCKNCYLHYFHIKKKQRKASASCTVSTRS